MFGNCVESFDSGICAVKDIQRNNEIEIRMRFGNSMELALHGSQVTNKSMVFFLNLILLWSSIRFLN